MNPAEVAIGASEAEKRLIVLRRYCMRLIIIEQGLLCLLPRKTFISASKQPFELLRLRSDGSNNDYKKGYESFDHSGATLSN
jgi:hypothetical protein